MKLSLPIIAIITVVLTWGCFGKSDSKSKKSSTDQEDNTSGLEIDETISTGEFDRDDSADADKVPPELLALQNSQANVAVKTFRLIDASFASVTGVSPANNTIRAIYADVATSLPSDNTIKSFSGANQVAIVKLAAGYCNEMVDDPALRTDAIGDISLIGPSSTLASGEGDQLIDALTLKFWGPSAGNMAEDAEAKSEISSLLTELGNEGDIDAMDAAKTICTAILASAPVVIY